jgi:hypothetical protein
MRYRHFKRLLNLPLGAVSGEGGEHANKYLKKEMAAGNNNKVQQCTLAAMNTMLHQLMDPKGLVEQTCVAESVKRNCVVCTEQGRPPPHGHYQKSRKCPDFDWAKEAKMRPQDEKFVNDFNAQRYNLQKYLPDELPPQY